MIKEIKLESEKIILRIQKIKKIEIEEREKEKIRSFAEVFDYYVKIKNEHINLFFDLKMVKAKIDKDYKEMKRLIHCMGIREKIGLNSEKSLARWAKLFNRMDDLYEKKTETEISLNVKRKEFNEVLRKMNELFVKIIPENKKLEKKENLRKTFFCPYCAMEMNADDFQSSIVYCPSCGTEIDATRLSGLLEKVKK